MKAVVLRDPSARVRVEEVELAPPGRDEVLVEIAAAGVCHTDLHLVRGDWPHPLPVILGHEGSGRILEVGAAVEGLAVGDHLVLSWVAPCGVCRYCLAGREARCSTWGSTIAASGTLADGTSRMSIGGEQAFHYLGVSSFAERAVLPASGVIKVRSDAPLEDIALVGCAVATGVGAVLNTAAVEPGSTVAVIGCGGVGLSIIQGAVLAGASRIIAVDVVGTKLDVARTLGATDAVLAGRGDAAKLLLDLLADGVDYAFDAIGHVSTTEAAIDMLGIGGAAVVVGLPATGSSAKFDPLALAEAERRILGCNYGSIRPHRDIPHLVDLVMEGRLRLDSLVSSRRSLEDAADALDVLATGSSLRTLLIP